MKNIIKKLYKGSKNPPMDRAFFLKTTGGKWGIGEAFRHNGKIYFDFRGKHETHFGREKELFSEWMEFPS